MRILTVFDTRSETKKMALLVDAVDSRYCVTTRNREILAHVSGLFKVIPDYDLNLMKANQILLQITSRTLLKNTCQVEVL